MTRGRRAKPWQAARGGDTLWPMRWGRLVALGVVALASPSAAEITASLTPAEAQDANLRPYRQADLLLANTGPSAVDAVVLRPAGGGPAVRYALAVPAGSDGRLTVALPAIWPTQEYTVNALDTAGAEVATASASISWADADVATGAFIDDAYRLWGDARATWPSRTRAEAVGLLAILVAASAGALFARSAGGRVAVIVAAACLVGLLIAHVPAWPGPVDAADHYLYRSASGQAGEVESFTVLSARSDSVWRRVTASMPYPVYADRAAADADDAEVSPADRSIRLTLRARQVRIIRPAPASAARPLIGAIVGNVRGDPADAATIRIDFPPRWPWSGSFIVYHDAVWAVGAGRGRLARTLRADRADSIGHLLSEPNRWGLDRPAARLLDYWRTKHQRPGQVYLVRFWPGGGSHLGVLQLARTPEEDAATKGPLGVTRPATASHSSQ